MFNIKMFTTKRRYLVSLSMVLMVCSCSVFAETLTFRDPKAEIGKYLKPAKLKLQSSAALVMDQSTGEVLYSRNEFTRRSIASITKVMTAMVIIDGDLPMQEEITILKEDKDRLRYSRSRLKVYSRWTRADLLELALMSSENRAASALARTYPGGRSAFVKAMNRKARSLKMLDSRFYDATGLDKRNVSTASDLALMVDAAFKYDQIRNFTTKPWGLFFSTRNRVMQFKNTNRLVRANKWQIGLSKTGYISDAGHCLVMQATIHDRAVIIVLLNSWGKLSKFGDANRIKKWLLKAEQSLEDAGHDKTS